MHLRVEKLSNKPIAPYSANTLYLISGSNSLLHIMVTDGNGLSAYETMTTININSIVDTLLEGKKGVNNGIASLDNDALVPRNQLPDFVKEVAQFSALPTVGQNGVLYVTLSDNNSYIWNGTDYISLTSNVDTVTSVSLSLPSIFTVTGSPVTSSGTLTAALVSQTTKTFLAAPNAANGAPTFRAILASDVPTLNQSTTGSAATLTTARTIGMTGDVTWVSADFNGSAAVTGVATLANSGVTAGTYTKVTVDAKGRVTTGDALLASDIPVLNQNTTGESGSVLSQVSVDANAQRGNGLRITNNTTGSLNFPDAAGITLEARRATGTGSAVGTFQLYSSNNAAETYRIRSIIGYTTNDVWSSWRDLLHSGNFNTYAPTLTGAGASGNWNIGSATVTDTQLGNTAHTLTDFPNAASFSRPAGYQTMLRVSGSAAAGLPVGHSELFFGYTILSRADVNSGYSALLTSYSNGDMYFTYNPTDTTFPVWRKLVHDGSEVVTSGQFSHIREQTALVTQLTSKATAVTINTAAGRIITSNSSLASNAEVIFQVNNNKVTEGSVVTLSIAFNSVSLGGTNHDATVADVSNGSFRVRIRNRPSVTRSIALTINFVVMGGYIP